MGRGGNKRSQTEYDRIKNEINAIECPIKILKLTPSECQISNGRTLFGKEKQKFISLFNRYRNPDNENYSWNTESIKKAHLLFSSDPNVVEKTANALRSLRCSLGGKRAQELHGNKIQQCMRKGGPWNKGTKGLMKCWAKGLTKESHPSLKKYLKVEWGN